MKHLPLLVTCAITAWGMATAEENPKIQTAMPPGIHHSKTATDTHRYEIRNIYPKFLPGGHQSNEQLEKQLRGAFPADLKIAEQVTLDIDLEKKTFALISPKILSSEEVTGLLYLLAGDFLVPSWHELLARELPESKILKDHQYLAKEIKPEVNDEIIWSKSKRSTPLRKPLALGKSNQGEFELTPTSRYCICHSYFTLRILDQEGGVVWKSSDELFRGTVKASLTDTDSDGWQEILVECDDHGTKKRFLVIHQAKD